MWGESLYICILLIVFVLIHQINSQNLAKSIHFVSAECNRNPNYLKEFTVNVSGNQTTLDIYGEIMKDFPKNVWLSLDAVLNPVNGHRSRPMFEHDSNICDLYSKRKSKMTGFVKSWLMDFVRYSNFPLICPVPKGNYSWLGLSLDKLKIPTFFPNARYEVNARAYIRKKPLNEMITHTLVLVEIK